MAHKSELLDINAVLKSGNSPVARCATQEKIVRRQGGVYRKTTLADCCGNETVRYTKVDPSDYSGVEIEREDS
jgi:hypothetical protein